MERQNSLDSSDVLRLRNLVHRHRHAGHMLDGKRMTISKPDPDRPGKTKYKVAAELRADIRRARGVKEYGKVNTTLPGPPPLRTPKPNRQRAAPRGPHPEVGGKMSTSAHKRKREVDNATARTIQRAYWVHPAVTDPVSLDRIPRRLAMALNTKLYDARTVARVNRVPHSRRPLTNAERERARRLVEARGLRTTSAEENEAERSRAWIRAWREVGWPPLPPL